MYTASIAGLNAGAGATAYSTCKAAVIGLTRSAAVELAPARIRVNALCPGLVLTPLLDRSKSNGLEAVLSKARPWPEAGMTEHIADAALFLAIAESRFVTGEALVVDGGITARGPGVFARDNPVFAQVLARREPSKRHRFVAFVDANVASTWPALVHDIESYAQAHGEAMQLVARPEVVPGGEQVKNDPALVTRLQHRLVELGVDRHSYVVGVGGGAFLDMIGFQGMAYGFMHEGPARRRGEHHRHLAGGGDRGVEFFDGGLRRAPHG